MEWGQTPEVRAWLGSETAALRFPVSPGHPSHLLLFPATGLFGVEPCMKSIAGLDFLPEVPAASNK